MSNVVAPGEDFPVGVVVSAGYLPALRFIQSRTFSSMSSDGFQDTRNSKVMRASVISAAGSHVISMGGVLEGPP